MTSPLIPECLDAGGGHRWVVDTTVSYLSPSNVAAALHGAPDAEVARAEKDKDKQVLAEVAHGKRSALPAGYTFLPAGINARGRMGPRLLKLMGWLAEHGATNGVNHWVKRSMNSWVKRSIILSARPTLGCPTLAAQGMRSKI